MTNKTQNNAVEINGANADAALKVYNQVMPLLESVQKEFPKVEMRYQSAKKAIYTLLTQVFDAYVAIQTSTDRTTMLKLLDNDLDKLKEQHHFPMTAATSLELKVLRYVLAECDLTQFRVERQKAYATTLRKGYEAMLEGVVYSSMDARTGVQKAPAKNTLDVWLIAMGGIEAARRGHKVKEERNDAPNASFAKVCSWARSHIIEPKTDVVVINDEAFQDELKQEQRAQSFGDVDDKYSVVLVKNSDYSVVSIFTDKAVVNAALGAQLQTLKSQTELNALIAADELNAAEEKVFSLDEALEAAAGATKSKETEAVAA